MEPHATLTEGDVSRWAGAASYGRGVRYARDGAIRDARREGDRLRASCAGSFPEPYRLWARLGARGIAEAACDCPVGDGGRCKHVVALLLTWLHHPEVFAEAQSLSAALAARSKEALVALIGEMVARHPDLEDLVAMPTPGDGPLDGHAVERQVQRILSVDGFAWGSAHRAGRDLERVARRGDAYAEVGDWASVATLCDVILTALVEHYEAFHDETGSLAYVVTICVEQLTACLEQAVDTEVRREAVRLLADVLAWNVGLGGRGLSGDVLPALTEHATAAERAAVGARIERELRGLNPSDRWGREALGGVLLALLPDDAGDEAYLRLARDSGRAADAVGRLLARGRLAEALEVARGVPDLGLLKVLPQFLDHGHGDAVDPLALGRLADDTDWRLVDWVKDRARDRGDRALARDLAERLFKSRPSRRRYAEVLALAATLGREDEARDGLRAWLGAERRYGVLTEAVLHDGEPDEALALLRLPKKEWPGAERTRLRLTVAEAVSGTRPEEAIQLYLDAVEHLVGRRNRSAYAEASQLLLAVRGLYRQRGRADDWALLLDELRAGYRALRALRDEMAKAGL